MKPCVHVRATLEQHTFAPSHRRCVGCVRRVGLTNSCLRARTCNIFDLHNLHKSKICVCFTNLRFVCKLTQIEDLCHTNCPVGARVFASTCVYAVIFVWVTHDTASGCTHKSSVSDCCVLSTCIFLPLLAVPYPVVAVHLFACA